jgi:hypothetical protein
VLGDVPSKPVTFVENGVQFRADVVVGQKTGFFLDQRDNRQRMQVRAWQLGPASGFSIEFQKGADQQDSQVFFAMHKGMLC